MRRRIIKSMFFLGILIAPSRAILADTYTLFYDGSSHTYTEAPILLYIDDYLVDTSAMPPVQFNGYTLVPAREVFEKTGAMVLWKSNEQKVYVDNGTSLIVLEINNKIALVNGQEVMLDMPAKVINNKVMIPTRFVGETLGYEIKWSAADRSVHIITTPNKSEVNLPQNNSSGMVDGLPDHFQDTNISKDPFTGDQVDNINGDWWLKLEHLVYSEFDESITLTGLDGLSVEAVHVDEQYHTKQISAVVYGNYANELPEGMWFKPTGNISSLQIRHLDIGVQLLLTTRKIQALKVYKSESGITLKCVTPSEKYDKIVVIDAGHGAHDSGATADGIREKDLTLQFALALNRRLQQDQSIKVYMTREDDTFLQLNERTAMANEIDPDLFISLHINSADNVKASGIETYYTQKADTRNKAFATIVQKALIDTFGKRDRGVKSNTYVVTKNTNAPAILIEIGFISNIEDRTMMTASGFDEQYANVLYQCILDYYSQGYDY